ncbi:MAG: hypothetical protein KJ007_02865 [Burkholderiales bacterium]|nr:hypothetical protein [Burkholderiales bacterium]
MKYLEIAKLVLALFPVLISAIKAVEEAIPGQGNGEQKLAMVRGVLENAFKVATDVTVQFEALWPALAGVIGSVVTAFNASGIFKK